MRKTCLFLIVILLSNMFLVIHGMGIDSQSIPRGVAQSSITPKLLWSYATRNIQSVSISSDGQYVAIGSYEDQKVIFFNTLSSEPLWMSNRLSSPSIAVSTSSDGSYIAVGLPREVCLFSSSSGIPLWTVPIPSPWTELRPSVAISADGSYIAVGNGDPDSFWGTLCLIDKSGSIVWSYSARSTIISVAISSDGDYIVAGTWSRTPLYGGPTGTDQSIYLFEKASGSPIWVYTTTNTIYDPMNDVTISADGSYLAAGSLYGRIYFFGKSSSNLLWSYNGFDPSLERMIGPWRSVAISSDGEYLFAGICDESGKVLLFHRSSGTQLWSYNTGTTRFGAVMSVSITSDGKYMLAGNAEGKIFFFSRDSETPLWSYSIRGQPQISTSFDGRYIAVSGGDAPLYLFESGIPESVRPDFDIQPKYEIFDLCPIGVNITELRITSVGGFEGMVDLSVAQPLPLGISVDLYSTSVSVPKDGHALVLLAIHTNSSTPYMASYEVVIQGSATFGDALITHSKPITVKVLKYSSDSSMSEGLVSFVNTQNYHPTGIADYGVNNGQPYSYSTRNFTAWMYFKSLDIGEGLGKALGAWSITLQLNAVNNITTSQGTVQYYWIQNVINIGQGPFWYAITGFYNVYNTTGNKYELISAHQLQGSLAYARVSGVRLPFNVTSSISTTIDVEGANTIDFSLKVTSQERTILGLGKTSYRIGLEDKGVLETTFYVNGKPRQTFINPPMKLMHAGNVEFVLCGRSAWISPEINLARIDGITFLGYKPKGFEQIVPVPHAFNFGLNTKEAVKNVDIQPLPPINNIFCKAYALSRKINLSQLW